MVLIYKYIYDSTLFAEHIFSFIIVLVLVSAYTFIY